MCLRFSTFLTSVNHVELPSMSIICTVFNEFTKSVGVVQLWRISQYLVVSDPVYHRQLIYMDSGEFPVQIFKILGAFFQYLLAWSESLGFHIHIYSCMGLISTSQNLLINFELGKQSLAELLIRRNNALYLPVGVNYCENLFE